MVVDPKHVKAARVPGDVDCPVVTAGSAAALAVANPHARNHDPRTTVTSAQLVPTREDVLESVLYRRLLCWLVGQHQLWRHYLLLVAAAADPFILAAAAAAD